MMRNINFTLSPADIELISNALFNIDESQELISLFSVLESQGRPVTIQSISDNRHIDFDTDDFPEQSTPAHTIHVDPKIVMMGGPDTKHLLDQEDVWDIPVGNPEPVKVVASHGWDERVPRPAPMEQPEPSNVPDKPTPAPSKHSGKVEPDFDHDERCLDCGGFTDNNPHSDTTMNCDCPADKPDPEPEPAPTKGGWSTAAGPDDKPPAGGNIWRT
jgi:hypothetical protein